MGYQNRSFIINNTMGFFLHFAIFLESASFPLNLSSRSVKRQLVASFGVSLPGVITGLWTGDAAIVSAMRVEPYRRV